MRVDSFVVETDVHYPTDINLLAEGVYSPRIQPLDPTMIEIEYIVKDHRGVERLRTADKKAADTYDRILENAERLAEWLRAGAVLPELPETQLEELTLHLARHAREVELILKGKRVETEAAPEHPQSPPTPMTVVRA